MCRNMLPPDTCRGNTNSTVAAMSGGITADTYREYQRLKTSGQMAESSKEVQDSSKLRDSIQSLVSIQVMMYIK